MVRVSWCVWRRDKLAVAFSTASWAEVAAAEACDALSAARSTISSK